MASKIQKPANKRFLKSYGAWLGVAEMLTYEEVVMMQLVCRYLYKIGVPRLHYKFQLRRPELYFLGSNLKHKNYGKIFFLLRYNTKKGTCTTLKHNMLNILENKQIVQFRYELYGFGSDFDPMQVV